MFPCGFRTRAVLAPLILSLQNKKNVAPKQSIKEASKKAKRAKFDTEAAHTVSDKLQKEAAQSEGTPRATQASASSGGAAATRVGADGYTPIVGRAKSLEELRARLHAKIGTLKAKREALERPREEGDGGRRRRGEKRARAEAEALANGEAGAKGKGKKARKEAGGAKKGKGSAAAAASGAGEDLAAQLTYGVIDTAAPQPGSKLKKGGGVKKLKGLLAKAEENEAKLAQLKATNKAEADAAQTAEAWEAAQRRAKGEKVKDDAALLRKALKRKEKAKEASRAKWAERTAAVEEAQAAKQKKRRENMQKRVDKKKASRMKKAGIVAPAGTGAKTGGRRARVGFEGRNTGFIN